jgi:phosphatidylserine/phosphatidylglycerophosphate/cardiolipin synthase-like enzyme
MNVALRAVHDALRNNEGAPARWATLIARIEDRVSGTVVTEDLLADVLRSMGIRCSTTHWCMNLRSLRVMSADGRLDPQAANDVGIALELAADSFDSVCSPISWTLVATLPPEVRWGMRPPALRQTAGVLLGLIDRSTTVIRMAAPFVDSQAMRFLFVALETARRRGVDISVITSVGRGMEFADLDAGSNDRSTGHVRITEVRTELSALGSHAKVLVVDDRWAYVGSANLTAAGFGRHVEIGVEVTGPQVEDLARLLLALERLGTRPFNSTVA